MSKENLISLISAICGAVIGIYWGPIGAALGALVAWIIPLAAIRVTENYRLKRRILNTLMLSELVQVRDVMRAHGIFVPADCFVYESGLPFVRALAKYRRVFLELEAENKVIHNERASVIYGYVDLPNDWVNQWSGRSYQKVSNEFLE